MCTHILEFHASLRPMHCKLKCFNHIQNYWEFEFQSCHPKIYYEHHKWMHYPHHRKHPANIKEHIYDTNIIHIQNEMFLVYESRYFLMDCKDRYLRVHSTREVPILATCQPISLSVHVTRVILCLLYDMPPWLVLSDILCSRVG